MFLLTTTQAFNQAVTLKTFHKTDYFINGIDLFDTITVPNTLGMTHVDYYIKNGANVIATLGSNDEPNDFPVIYNLGSLPVGASIEAQLFNGMGSQGAPTPIQFTHIIDRPAWLDFPSVSVAVTGINYPSIYIHSTIDIVNALSAGSSENDIPGLKGKTLDLSGTKFSLDIDYDLATNQGAVNAPKVDLGIDIMHRANFNYTVPVNSFANLTITPPFDLSVTIEDSIQPTPFTFNFPKFRFYPPFLPIPITLDGGVTLQPQVKGKVVAGFSSANNSWGFTDGGGTNNTRLVAKLKGTGFLRISAEAGIASAWGSITLAGSIGGGLQYSSFTTPTTTPLFGYTLSLYGTVGYRIGAPCFTNPFTGNEVCLNTQGTMTKDFWSNTSSGYSGLGLLPNANQNLFDEVNAKDVYESFSRSSQAYEIPEFFAQPSFAQRDSNLAIVWRDYDDNRHICFEVDLSE